uniref:Uncharacterized protein n=2 Tax=Anas TaxID=8835 RepID=A0A8B9TTE5_ANAPL
FYSKPWLLGPDRKHFRERLQQSEHKFNLTINPPSCTKIITLFSRILILYGNCSTVLHIAKEIFYVKLN